MNLTSSLTQLMQTYYDRMFLDRAKPSLSMWQFGQKRDLPVNSGVNISYTRYTVLPAATTALSEGANPAGRDLSATSVTGTIAEYGDYTQISSLVSATAIDKDISEKVELFSDQASLTVEQIVRNAVVAQTSQIIYANGKLALGDVSTTDILQVLDIQKGVRKLKKQKAMKVNGYWICLIGPDVEYDITRDPNWVLASEYAGSTPLFEGEVGKWFGTRFVYTTEPNIQSGVGSGGADVYSNLMFGKNAYGVIDFPASAASGSAAAPHIIVKKPGPTTTADPLNRFGTCGWQLTFGQLVLNTTWIVNIKSGVTPES